MIFPGINSDRHADAHADEKGQTESPIVITIITNECSDRDEQAVERSDRAPPVANP